MTKLLVGVALFITFLLGLVMMASVGIIGGSAASPTAQQEIPPNYLALYRSAADWQEPPPHNGQVLKLVCRPSLDVHSGTAGWYRQRQGNLRSDGGQAVLGRALQQGGRFVDAVWFGPDRLSAVAGLAARYGDRTGHGVHFTETSVRYLWLDRARRAARAAASSR